MPEDQNTANITPLNVALIGVGMVAETHLNAIADLEGSVRLQGVLARRAASGKAFAKKAERLCGYAPTVYASLEELVQDKSLDFAIVLTPPNARLEIVEALAEAGVHVLMEKPVERSGKAASQLVEICDQKSAKLGIVFQFRVREASIKLRELVQAGALGKLGLVDVVVPWWRDQSYYDEPGRGTYARDGGGVLISQAIHTLDLMLSLTGDVREVQAMARTTSFHDMEAEDFVTAGLEFENGAVGSLVASTASFPGDAESIVLHFDKCVAVLKSGVLVLKWRDGREEQFGEIATTGGGADPMAFTHAWHQDVIANFITAIREDTAPLVPGIEALKVHQLIDAIVSSSKLKRAVKLEEIRNT